VDQRNPGTEPYTFSALAVGCSASFRPGPWRSAILIAGDKPGQWKTWYDRAIPRAEELYEVYLKERAEERKKTDERFFQVGP
jgi:hypothetical protein